MTAASQGIFLTQSSRSRSAEGATITTVSTATQLRLSGSRSGAVTVPPSTPQMLKTLATSVGRLRTATTAESIQRMASERQRRADGVRLVARLERTSSEMIGYEKRRFRDACDDTETASASSSTQDSAVASGFYSKCALSPYATVTMETPAASSRAADSEERKAGQQRARLMNELRLRQAKQLVRYRHDRTAQELAQEGVLTSRARSMASGYPWPQAYKYTPFPQPRVSSWLAAERTRAKEAVEAAEKVEAVETEAEAAEAEAAEAEAAEAEAEVSVLIELAVQGSVELPVLELMPHASSGIKSWQQQRKSSDSRLRPSSYLPSSYLAPVGGGLGKRQRSKSQAAVHQRSSRLFSVSTIGEEERARRRIQLRTLAQVCQQLRNRQRTAEAGAPATAVAADAAVALLADEIESAAGRGQLCKPNAGEADGDQLPLPLMPCPGSEAKTRQHLTRVWLRRHRLSAPPPIIS